MSARAASAAIAIATGFAVAFGLVAIASASVAEDAARVYPFVAAALVLLAAALIVWHLEPAYTLSAGIFLTPLAGHWPKLGIPGPLSPDRLLLAGGIAAVVLRAPAVADRPRLRIACVHLLLALAAAYVLCSALFAGTLLERDPLLKIVDAFGILPFLVFLVAPLAFRTPEQRNVLLVTLVALGAYLGLTTLFETVGLDALVFPRYILDPEYGIHAGRGRGPFADAVANGLGLYTCAVGCAIAAATWRRGRPRVVALAVGLLCLVGAFLCLQRSVWLGAAAATCVAMLVVRGARRHFVNVLVASAVGIGVALLLVPGLSERVRERVDQQGTIWDRKNLARAAVNMVEARPLVGFGWSRFQRDSADYFEQAFDYPLTATSGGVHNTPLSYAAELGLIGLTLWALGLLFGIGGALASHGPPDLLPWRVGLLAVAVSFVVVLSAVPPIAGPNRWLWLFAGVAYAGRYARVTS